MFFMSVKDNVVFDHMKYILSVCVWQREGDYSLYILLLYNRGRLDKSDL